ncbi:MAG TPA: hypothetical protein VIF57_21650, partial [Polyangia bacterium]
MTAARLGARGVATARDLLMRLPGGYDDLGRITPIGALGGVADGAAVLVRGTVKRLHVFPRRLLDVIVEEDGATVRARWFRAHASMAKAYVKGSTVALAGAVRTAADGTREMVHPSNVSAALAAAGGGGLGLRARYPDIEGVPRRTLAAVRASALAALADAAAELLPAPARARLELPTLAAAFRALHAPQDAAALGADALARARRRVALESLFVTQVAFLRRRAELGGAALALPRADAARAQARLEGALGFALTASQRRALHEIAGELARPAPMQRLLVGDVGSGKTAVALGAAALMAAAGG